MGAGFAERFVKGWAAAWNSHDLERVLTHFEDDCDMSSAVIAQRVGDASEKLRETAAVRACWAKALHSTPDLRCELLTVLIGVNSISVYYKGHRGLAVDVFHFGPSG